MGLFIYNLSIHFMHLGIMLASIFDKKAKQFFKGRRNILNKIDADFQNHRHPIAWFHCASLGEFEQGRPVMEAFKKEFPDFKILLTFFSPSGYEAKKTYRRVDFIYYLPLDTASNAKRFIKIVNPAVAYFIKYEFWYHYLNELQQKGIPAISFSTIFREDQLFFKSYGGFYRNILTKFTHIFVQNKLSTQLLKSIDISQVTLTGDTRFDRVAEICKQAQVIPIAEKFKAKANVMIIGSSWPEDMEILQSFINRNPFRLKFIIAPHEIKESQIIKLSNQLKHSVRYSKSSLDNVAGKNVLIIDNVGMLSSLYQYGEYAYIGGAFGKGLHNILEAATFGMPILFGNKNYWKFQEAVDLIEMGGAKAIADARELEQHIAQWQEENKRKKAAEICKSYIQSHKGATAKIINYSKSLLKQGSSWKAG